MELSQSQHNTDNQMAVQIRMDILQHNATREVLRQLILKVAVEAAPELIASLPDPVTFNRVNQLFEDWDTFRKRPDHKALFKDWYLGHNLSDLPPAPSTPEVSGDSPEGAGGKDAEATKRNEVAQTQDGPTS
jgi:hypothetical protein